MELSIELGGLIPVYGDTRVVCIPAAADAPSNGKTNTNVGSVRSTVVAQWYSGRFTCTQVQVPPALTIVRS